MKSPNRNPAAWTIEALEERRLMTTWIPNDMAELAQHYPGPGFMSTLFLNFDGGTVDTPQSGIKRIIMPERNKKDLNDVPEQAKREMEFVFAHSMDDVLRSALEEDPFEKAAKNPPPSDGGQPQPQEQQQQGTPQVHA